MSNEHKYEGEADVNGQSPKNTYHDGPNDLPSLNQTPSYIKDTAHVTHEDLHLAGKRFWFAITISSDSIGVKRIEATSAQLGKKSRPLAFFGVLLIAYAISIDGVSLDCSSQHLDMT